MSCQCYVTFDLALAFVFILTFEHQSLGLGLELLSLESKPDYMSLSWVNGSTLVTHDPYDPSKNGEPFDP